MEPHQVYLLLKLVKVFFSRAGNFFNKYNPLTRANFTKAGNIMRSGYGMATGPAAYGTAAALSGPAFIGGLAYLNRPTTVKELEFMKNMMPDK